MHFSTFCLAGCRELKDLPDTIGGLTELRSLVLSGCIALTALPSTISSMTLLTNLDMQGCEHLGMLPSCIWELQSLKMLRLQGCLRLRNFMGPKECLQNMDVLGLPLVPPEEYLFSPLRGLGKPLQLHGKWGWLFSQEKSLQEWVDENKMMLEPLPSDHYEYINAKVHFIKFHILMPISLKERCSADVIKSYRCKSN